MKKIMTKLSAATITALAFIAIGCIVSGTFIVVEDFSFTAQSEFYFYQVDITDDATWAEHKDDIQFIDVVGVEFYITSSETGPVTFDAWIDDYSGAGSNPTLVPSSATKIIDGFTVQPGVSKITYAQSLGILTGISRLKALAMIGQFDYYGTSSGNIGTSFVVDSAKIIITFSGGE